MDAITRFIKAAMPLYNFMKEPILICRIEGDVCYVNTEYTEYTGFGADFITGHMIQEFEVGSDTRYSDILSDLGKRETGERKITFRSAKGEALHCTLIFSLLKDVNNQAIGVLFLFRPRSEHSPVNPFRNYTQLIKALNTRSDEIMIMSSLDKNEFLFCSDAYEKITGWSSEEYIKGGWARSIANMHPDDVPMVNSSFLNGLNRFLEEPYVHDNIPLKMEYRIRHKSGRFIWIGAESFILDRDEVGNIQHLIIFLRDITPLKKKEQPVLSDARLSRLLNSGSLNELNRGAADESAVVFNGHPLSPREKELIILIRKGFTSKEIAKQLGLSLHTVHSYRKKLLEKLNVKNTAELVRISTEQNLL